MSDDLLKRADNCGTIPSIFLVSDLSARVRELEAERYLLLNLYEAAKQLADNAEEYDCDGLGLFAQHGWWEPLHEALEALNDDSTT